MKKVLLAIGFLALVLLVTEVYLRLESTYVVNNNARGLFVESNPELLVQYTSRGRRLVPNAHVVIRNHWFSQKDIAVDTNSLGFRGPELPPGKSNGAVRILVLGDSIAIQDYLPYETLYTTKLGELLQSDGRDQPRYEVINAGIGNVGTEEEINILEEHLGTVQPDLVLLAFYLNDSRPAWGFAGEIGDRGWLRRHSLLAAKLYEELHMKRWLAAEGIDKFAWISEQARLDWRRRPEDLQQLASLARYDWGAAWEASSWPVIERQFARLRRLADEQRFRIAVAAFPVSFQVEADYLDTRPQQQLQKLSQQFDFAFLDLLPALRQHASEKLFFDQCHPTERGNQIIADALARFVRSLPGQTR